MVERGDCIAAARDRDQRAFAGQRSGSAGESDGGGVERRGFECTERAVPDEGAAVLQHIGERLYRGWADIEDHFIGGDFMDVDGARWRIGPEFA